MRRKFFGSARELPSRKLPFHYSPIAIRYSLPFSAQREHLTPVLSTD